MIKTICFCLLSVFLVPSQDEIPHDNTIVKQEKSEIVITDSLHISKNFILGKFNYKSDSTFTKISSSHTSKTIYLNKEVYAAFIEMFDSALKDGVKLNIVSGTRSFNEQKWIWEAKWEQYKHLDSLDRAKKILRFSAMPTTSRHHWGTEIDLINSNNAYYDYGKGKKAYDWLLKNANDFGFYQVYTNKENGRTGYEMEKWHWSYLALADKYLNYYNENIDYDDICDFKGAELANKLRMIDVYVNGVTIDQKNSTDITACF